MKKPPRRKHFCGGIKDEGEHRARPDKHRTSKMMFQRERYLEDKYSREWTCQVFRRERTLIMKSEGSITEHERFFRLRQSFLYFFPITESIIEPSNCEIQ